jgi:hypothetical protein
MEASWGDLGVPDYDVMVAKLGAQQIVAAKPWVDDHPDHTLKLDATAPGLDDTWQVATGTEGGCVEVISQANGVTRSSGTCQP